MSDGITDSQDWDVKPKANPVQWVISKYAPETGEKWEALPELEDMYTYFGKIPSAGCYNVRLPKSEYIPTTPPEQWEEVPITDNVLVSQDGRKLLKRYNVESWCSENEQFIIQDGKLVLQRRRV